ncbi:hypothetical protein Agau_L300504 [Agrobacterium tumefaciens F2]|nr:hypothetical protein Agau_L300504 [Agrobacterium tumefaciens F2]
MKAGASGSMFRPFIVQNHLRTENGFYKLSDAVEPSKKERMRRTE